MNNVLLSAILVKLGTMDGRYWPALRDDDDELDPDRASYAEVLMDLPDETGGGILRGVLTAFMARPSHKALRQWAVGLVPQPSFDIRQLDGPRQTLGPGGVQTRLTGPKMDRLGDSVRAVGPAPPSVKAEMAEFRRQAPASPPEGRREFGLEFATGRTEASYTQSRAQALADERNRQWPHQHTGVFRKGDPVPEGAKWARAAPITPADVSSDRAERRRVPDLPVPSPEGAMT